MPTLEELFVTEYQALKAENIKLKKQLEEKEQQQQPQREVVDGFTDLHKPIELIYVQTALSYYKLFENDESPFSNATEEELTALFYADDFEIADLLQKTRIYDWSDTCIIKVIRNKFPFTLSFTTYKENKVFAYDPDYDDETLYDFYYDEVDIEHWVSAHLEDECLLYAVGKFKDIINDRIKELKAEQEKDED